MVANFVQLKLTLMRNVFRRSIWQTIGFCVAAFSALSAVVTVVTLAFWGGGQDLALTGQILTVTGAALMLCWWILPVLFFGVDATLDAQRFAMYPIPRRTLLAGLAAAGLCSVPGFATALALLGVALAWWRNPLALVAALVGALAGTALCIVGSRTITTLAAPWLESRRAREVLSIVAFLLIMAISPAINWFAALAEQAENAGDGAFGAALRDGLGAAANWLGWTPFGAPWALASAVAEHQWLAALARLLVLVGTLALATLAWSWALRRELERSGRVSAATKQVSGLGFFDRFSATPTGAVAARSATYWVRDPRYGIGLIAVVMMPLILYFTSRLGDGEAAPVVLMIGPFVGWMLGFSLANDVSTDDTAFALHLATGVPGRADRWGRLLPVLIIGVPAVTLLAVFSVWTNGRWDWLPPILGLSLALLMSSLGVASATSARWLYPTVKPGGSPLRQPQGSTGASMVAQSVSLGLSAVAAAIPTALTVAALLTHGAAALVLGWLALVVGIAVGLGVLVYGVRWGGRILERRGPEILQQIRAFP